jgi:choline dehydrogenase-like flavoprotein
VSRRCSALIRLTWWSVPTRWPIVDASVFPRIPGFFVAAPIYMISEKASDVILADTVRA